jgi:hypothetical protein
MTAPLDDDRPTHILPLEELNFWTWRGHKSALWWWRFWYCRPKNFRHLSGNILENRRSSAFFLELSLLIAALPYAFVAVIFICTPIKLFLYGNFSIEFIINISITILLDYIIIITECIFLGMVVFFCREPDPDNILHNTTHRGVIIGISSGLLLGFFQIYCQYYL